MLESQLSHRVCINRLIAHLKEERYSPKVLETYPGPAKRFLNHLQRRGLTVATVQVADVQRYLQGLQMVKKRCGRATPALRRIHRAAIVKMLRLVRKPWPPELVMTAREAAQRQLLEGYESWMRDVQGRGAASCGARRAEARQFLSWGERQEPQLSVGDIGVSDLDRFIEERGTQLCRVSLSSLVDRLKNFLRYLHFTGEISCDLAATVRGPRIYTDEEIPSAFSAETVREVVQNSRRNRSPLGRRDHAICVLLATYGLRAGEIIGLRLEDIDWKNEVLRVRHFKTNQHSQLPLLRAPAQALLDYLRYGRPKTAVREVFLRALAPYRPLSCSASVHHIVQRYLSARAKRCEGRKGAHAFRHACAVGLMRAAVPLKTIGDVLGHRSPRSTQVYLKLATQDLRAVGLEVPSGVSP